MRVVAVTKGTSFGRHTSTPPFSADLISCHQLFEHSLLERRKGILLVQLPCGTIEIKEFCRHSANKSSPQTQIPPSYDHKKTCNISSTSSLAVFHILS